MNLCLDDIRQDITDAVQVALREDIGSGDITAQLIPIDQQSTANVITREACVICGVAWFDEVFQQLGAVDTQWHVQDGDFVEPDTKLVTLRGSARNILTGERSALNFLQLLSGTATMSRDLATIVEHTDIKILDTRKTIPGLRTAQKYAVVMGGCHNHRIGLYDAFLIKENHIAASGGITKAVEAAKKLHPTKPVIIEVENINEFNEAIKCPVDRIMLDNFSAQDFQHVQNQSTTVPIEISGNINAKEIEKLAGSNIAAISSGSLTKHVRAIDLSLRLI